MMYRWLLMAWDLQSLKSTLEPCPLGSLPSLVTIGLLWSLTPDPGPKSLRRLRPIPLNPESAGRLLASSSGAICQSTTVSSKHDRDGHPHRDAIFVAAKATKPYTPWSLSGTWLSQLHRPGANPSSASTA